MKLEDVLPAYLGRQRWFAGEDPSRVRVARDETLADGLRWLLVEADDALYQVLVGTRPADPAPAFLEGQDKAVLGEMGGMIAFDALLDPDFARVLLARVAPGEPASRVRPMGVEQSNTSLVFDERLILKVFRRLHAGPNPDVEVTTALAAQGFEHVAAPLGSWRDGDLDLALCQRFLAGGKEGWALALGFLRELFEGRQGEGNFAGEARRLGEMTASMHLALAEAFGSRPGDAAAWASLVEVQMKRLEPGDADPDAARRFVERMRAFEDAGKAIRVHGDFHLGQTMRTDERWFVLDFEGEPARPIQERQLPASPLKDVSGIIRSFQYAAEVALSERDASERAALSPLGQAWEARSRAAFLDGYVGTPGIDALLPADAEDRSAVLSAFELDKAVYEVLYERAYRPGWVGIPLGAVRRLLGA